MEACSSESATQATKSTSPPKREHDDDDSGAPTPASQPSPDRESTETVVPVVAPDVGAGTSTAPEKNSLESLPEEWQALGRKFDFTYNNILCLMSTTRTHTPDETWLAELATALETALEGKDWNRAQSLLCLLLCIDPVYTADATIIIRLMTLAERASLASESQADFTSRLGKAVVEPLAALVKLLRALEPGTPTGGVGNGGGGGGRGSVASSSVQSGGRDTCHDGGPVPAEARTRPSGNHLPRVPLIAGGVQKRSTGNRKLFVWLERWRQRRAIGLSRTRAVQPI